jgi:hypothetical protein
MNKFVMRGAEGAVMWSYHAAASLKDWTVTADSAGHRLTAQVVSHDAFRVSQQPLTFVVPRPTGQWTWPITSLQIAGTALIATVGPPE